MVSFYLPLILIFIFLTGQLILIWRCADKKEWDSGLPMIKSIDYEKKVNVRDRQMERQMQLRKFCRKTAFSKNNSWTAQEDHFIYSEAVGALYCWVPKVACTNWKRVMQVLNGEAKDVFHVERDKYKVHQLEYTSFNTLRDIQKKQKIKEVFYSFMFVRHPFERLVSAYRNRLSDPDKYATQKKEGAMILRMYRKNLTALQYRAGKGVTFKEFVDFVLYVYSNQGIMALNRHWRIMNFLCDPCAMKYNFIGKYETLLEDAEQVLKDIGVSGRVKFPYNLTDKYKSRSRDLINYYFSTIDNKTINNLYEMFETDFVAFGYKMPDFPWTQNTKKEK